jgi:hypothetical protein
LGLVHQSGFARQLGRSEASNHLGNVGAAALAGLAGYLYGFGAVFVVPALFALPLRGALASPVARTAGLVPVQILDGIGAGILGVAVPGLVARIVAGSGHVNAGLGAVTTLQGVGAAFSPTVGDVMARHAGYPAAFLALAMVARQRWCCGSRRAV